MMILKKRRRKRTFYKLIILIAVSFVFSILFIKFYSDKTAPIVINYSEDEIRRLILLVINNSVGESTEKIDTNELFVVRYNEKGEIILIDFDSKKSSLVLNGVTNLIEYNLKEIEDGNVDKFRNYYSDYNYNLLKRGIIVEVPFGASFNNKFLNNLGPKIPVRISFTKNIETVFNTEVTEYGINNALIKLNINIKISVRVILPFVSNTVDNNFTIPVAMKVIQGNIPNYYMGGFTADSNIITGD